MVIIFSRRNSRFLKEIANILCNFGCGYIDDRKIVLKENCFSVIAEYNKTNIDFIKGVVVFCDDTEKFNGQTLPPNAIGVSDGNNRNALNIFKNNKTAAISCGMNPKNTITLSSIENGKIFISLQRTIIDINGNKIEPGEYKMDYNNSYDPFSYLISLAVLLVMDKYTQ